jgi:osmotically-inducible protein OsmY
MKPFKQNSILLYLTVMILTQPGCVSTAIVAGTATAFGTMLYDQRDLSTIHDDYAIKKQFLSNINKDPLFTTSDVQAKTINHQLLIYGQTPEYAQKERAETYAHEILKVQKVYNQLEIRKPLSSWEKSQDAWLTTKVKSAFVTSQKLRSLQISVASNHATVYLLGIIPHSQANLATNIASKVKGVKRVVRLLLPVA